MEILYCSSVSVNAYQKTKHHVIGEWQPVPLDSKDNDTAAMLVSHANRS